jgi:hypothetical protein
MGIRIFVVAGKLIPPRSFGRVNRLDYLYIHPMLKRAKILQRLSIIEILEFCYILNL